MINLPPIVFPPAFPEEDRKLIDAISNNLAIAYTFCEDFHSAVEQYRYHKAMEACEIGKPFKKRAAYYPHMLIRWMANTAKAGIVTLWNYNKVVSSTIGLVRSCKSLSPLVHMGSLTQANAIFLKHFPSFQQLRTGVAHAGEKYATDQQNSKNSYSGEAHDGDATIASFGQNTIIVGCFFNDTYALSLDGALHQILMTPQTAENLRESYNSLIGAFAPTEQSTGDYFKSITDKS